MDEIKTSEEGENNPKKPWERLFSGEWTEAWKQLEERVRQRPGPHLLMALAVGYLLQIIPFRSLLVLAVKLCLMLARPVLFLVCAFEVAKYVGKASSSGSTGDIAASNVRKEKQSAPQKKVDSEQLQHRAYLIAERRKSLGVGGDETGDWAQAERELQAEATGK